MLKKNISRINLVVPEETKNKWDLYVKEGEISTLSKLIRESVEYYIDSQSKMGEIKALSDYSHDLKEELNSIKGFSQLLIEEYKDQLSWDILLKIKEIHDKGINIEKILNKILNLENVKKAQYDVLIVDDDDSTLLLLSDFFKKRGVISINTSSAEETYEVLDYSVPKLILLDVLLPRNSGYEICTKIKSIKRLKEVPVYYITAVPEVELYEKIKETNADGYFLKPFNIGDFDPLIDKYKLKHEV